MSSDIEKAIDMLLDAADGSLDKLLDILNTVEWDEEKQKYKPIGV